MDLPCLYPTGPPCYPDVAPPLLPLFVSLLARATHTRPLWSPLGQRRMGQRLQCVATTLSIHWATHPRPTQDRGGGSSLEGNRTLT